MIGRLIEGVLALLTLLVAAPAIAALVAWCWLFERVTRDRGNVGQ